MTDATLKETFLAFNLLHQCSKLIKLSLLLTKLIATKWQLKGFYFHKVASTIQDIEVV